ncbi:MAG TPA: transglutaminase family protein [Steroidobacteraceae bacterium]
MTILNVHHRTCYRYSQPVEFGEHRLMLRPRDSHDLRLIDTTLRIDPPPSALRWMHDVFGNSIAIATFDRRADTLTFESAFRAEHFPAVSQEIVVEPYASRFPFSYSADDAVDLGRTKERHYADPDHRIDQWVKNVLNRIPEGRTFETLVAMTSAIREQFQYVAREPEGVQEPLETLALRSGSCRDFAVFMIEAARSLALGARFVSGYLYDEHLIGAAGGMVGTGSTHAWVQVYLPGAGWVEFDPTNALVGGRNLIRVAVARDAAQAAPLVGSFKGAAQAFLSLSVEVTVMTE